MAPASFRGKQSRQNSRRGGRTYLFRALHFTQPWCVDWRGKSRHLRATALQA